MGTLHSRISRGAKTEQGAIAIIVAISMVGLLVVAGMVLDFGLARLDRQDNKSAADSAVTAGIGGLDQGGTDIFSFKGVCDALTYLKVNKPELASLSYSECGVASNLTKVCDSTAAPSTWPSANYTVTTTSGYTVQIQSPYTLPDPNFSQDALASLSSDTGSPCDNLAVIITQARKPGLGSLATSSQLKTTIRSVGRVALGAGDTAPALLILERSQCAVLVNGSSGSASRIRVYGSVTNAGLPTVATIHSDSKANDLGTCGTGSNKQLFQGRQADGIVAYGATDGKPGVVSSVATADGVGLGVVIDSSSNVYGTTALTEVLAGTKSIPAVSGRKQVTRKPVDTRYAAGRLAAISAANAKWDLVASTLPAVWTVVPCRPSDPAALLAWRASLTSATKLYVDCDGGIKIDSATTSPLIIQADEVFFKGDINGGHFAMPNATAVYVNNFSNNGDGIALSTGNAVCIRSSICELGSLSTGRCSSLPTSAQAQLFIRQGNIKQFGSSLLRLCNTTVTMLGGQRVDGCIPTYSGTPPDPALPPCTSGSGSGQMVSGGIQDWTAPNAYPDMSTRTPAQQKTLWDGGEDLALWSESAGAFSMQGGGDMHVEGVFMTPNAWPFDIGGNGTLDLTNAQFMVRTFTLHGTPTLLMSVDSDNAVTIPKLDPILVR